MRRPSSHPPELPGYTFERVLGSGGFSDVYLYEQKLPKRRVAVKVLLTDELSGANRSAFVGEANLMAQLSTHPYIVSIYQADVSHDDRPYFVMEYCSGPSLAERYKRETFTVADALRIGVRLSSAIATAHGAGILHRDIKPANVLTNDYGWPALTDFGISSAVDEDALPVHTGTLADALNDSGATGSESIGMSVPWSPPEMFEDDPQPDVRSDVFSLAATIYTILAGYTPFEVRGRSNGTLDLIGRIERGAITPLERDDVPRSLVAVLRKGMASDRGDRFGTAVDFARALQRVELELGYTPTAIDVPGLDIVAASRGEGPDDADATRVRDIAIVDAQPVSTVPASSDEDETRLRGARVVTAQTAPAQRPAELGDQTVIRPRDRAQAEAVPPDEDSPAPKTNRLVLWIAGGLLAIVAASVTIGLVFQGVPGEPEGDPSPSSSGGSATIETVPAPALTQAAADGTKVVFTISNPEPEAGDSFVWKRSDRGAGEATRRSDDGILVVDGYTPGATVCIQAAILRDGSTSANPLETCFPQ